MAKTKAQLGTHLISKTLFFLLAWQSYHTNRITCYLIYVSCSDFRPGHLVISSKYVVLRSYLNLYNSLIKYHLLISYCHSILPWCSCISSKMNFLSTFETWTSFNESLFSLSWAKIISYITRPIMLQVFWLFWCIFSPAFLAFGKRTI